MESGLSFGGKSFSKEILADTILTNLRPELFVNLLGGAYFHILAQAASIITDMLRGYGPMDSALVKPEILDPVSATQKAIRLR